MATTEETNLREWWIVQYRKNSETKFRFCDTESQARQLTKDLTAQGYSAACWDL